MLNDTPLNELLVGSINVSGELYVVPVAAVDKNVVKLVNPPLSNKF